MSKKSVMKKEVLDSAPEDVVHRINIEHLVLELSKMRATLVVANAKLDTMIDENYRTFKDMGLPVYNR